MWQVILFHSLAFTLIASTCLGQTEALSPSAPQEVLQGCSLDRGETAAILMFAVENHAVSIGSRITECEDLLRTSQWNTRDAHLTYWENLIHPKVASIRDSLDQVMSLSGGQGAETIAPHVAALEDYTATAIGLLTRSGKGPADDNYSLVLTAASQRAQRIVQLVEAFWTCDGVRAAVDASLQSRHRR